MHARTTAFPKSGAQARLAPWIGSTARRELRRSLHPYAAVFQIEHPVRALENTLVVRNHYERSFALQILEHLDKRILTRLVQVVGRLVEHEHLRPPQQRARDRQPLALAARQKNAAFTDLCLTAQKTFDMSERSMLYERAQELDIERRSDMTKDELIEALRS